MSELSKERLEKIASWRETYGSGHNVVIPAEEAEVMAREILECRERDGQEPDYIRYDCGCCGWETIEDWRDNDACPKCNHKPMGKAELYATPPAPVVPDDYFASLVTAARARAEKAMRKFPQPNYVLNKVAEESGEVIKAVIHYTEGRETWQNVETEIIDNLAMLIRLVAEGDGVIGFTPPDACRAAMLTSKEAK